MGQKQKTEKKKRKKEEERLNDGKNNGQATHGARKHAWRTQAAWANVSGLLSVEIFLCELNRVFLNFQNVNSF